MSRPAAVTQENYYTVHEVSAALRVDRHTVAALFAGETGVLTLGTQVTTRGRRRYRQLRIPQSVLNRVIARRSVRQ
jgi:hypothetical protein